MKGPLILSIVVRALGGALGWLLVGLLGVVVASFSAGEDSALALGPALAGLVVIVAGGTALIFSLNQKDGGVALAVSAVVALAVYGLVFRGFELTFVESVEGLQVYRTHDGSQAVYHDEVPRLILAGYSSQFGLAAALVTALVQFTWSRSVKRPQTTLGALAAQGA